MTVEAPASFPFTVKEHILPASHVREYARATQGSQETTLRLHVKEYIPKDNPEPQQGDVTIIGAHANGFPKELYEPLWEDLWHESKKQGWRVRSIIISDVAWQGQSGLLNKDHLGNDPSWFDGARDTLHLINTLRPPMPLIGIGHSLGGNILTNVALMHPRLFSSLVLLDPVIQRSASNPGPLSQSPAVMSLRRRQNWPRREEAMGGRLMKGWDDRVRKRWGDFGVKVIDEKSEAGRAEQGRVELVTSRDQEVFTFLRPSWDAYDEQGEKLINPAAAPDVDPEQGLVFPLYRAETASTFLRLAHLRPPVLYVFGGTSNLSPPEGNAEKLALTGSGVGGSGGQTAGKVEGVVGEEYGHLIPMEAPGFCAKEAARWMRIGLDGWRVEMKAWKEWDAGGTAEEKRTVGEAWKVKLGLDKDGRMKSKM